ncbi:GTP cyclohydrolase 1 type 2 [Clostridia bacterium]|nr:GTP cyclohydrolase 1 type 2 [Clostridia bacterium]
MTVIELSKIIEKVAPPEMMWCGDNVGLLVGRRGAEVTKALVALDVSLAVIAEAKDWGAEVILTHHPVIFHPVKSVTDADAAGRRITALIQSDIAAIALHTNYDGAWDGVNDELARRLQLADIEVLANAPGDYLRAGTVSEIAVPEFAEHAAKCLNAKGLRFYDSGKPVRRVATGSGGSGDKFARAIAEGCDTYVSGDISHDVFCDARDMGLNLIDAGHFATEDVMCELLIRQLSEFAPGLKTRKSVNSLAPFGDLSCR